MRLDDLVGKEVQILSPKISPKRQLFKVKVRGIEPAGMWIEDQNLTEIILTGIGATMHDTTPVFFVPFHMIECVIDYLDLPAISGTIAK